MIRWGALAGLLVLAADQLSKWWVLTTMQLNDSIPILPVLNLTYIRNPGVTFGLFQQDSVVGTWLLVGVALAVVAALTVWMARAERVLVACALGAIAGGAIGNIIDRIRFGAVVDFLHAHAWGYSWYVFNVADAAIVCGVAALVLDGLRPPRSRLQAPGLPQ